MKDERLYSAQSVAQELAPYYTNLEQFFLIPVKNSRMLGFHILATGTSKQVDIPYDRMYEILKECNADSCIIAHNHPSFDNKFGDTHFCVAGNKMDLIATGHIFQFLLEKGITLVDHIIFSSKTFFSFRDNALISGYRAQQPFDVDRTFGGRLDEETYYGTYEKFFE